MCEIFILTQRSYFMVIKLLGHKTLVLSVHLYAHKTMNQTCLKNLELIRYC